MADAVHQVLVDHVPGGVLLARRLGSGDRGAFLDGSLAVEDGLDELLRLVDAGGDIRGEDLLAAKACTVDVLVCSDDDALCVGDLVSRQDVLGACRALGLGLKRDAHLLGLLLQILGCHVGVGNAGRAGGDGKDLRVSCSCHCLRSGLGSICCLALCLGVVDHGHELFRRLGSAQGVCELLMHQKLRELGKHLEVRVVLAFRSCNHEHEVGRRIVRCIPVHAARYRHRCQARTLHGCGLGMRNGDAVADGRRELCLAGKDGLLVGNRIVDVA